jgi:mRNA interferase HigB
LIVFILKTILPRFRIDSCEDRWCIYIISKKRLVAAGEKHPDALPGLMRWYRVARKARWNDIHETRADFPHADPVDKFTVFNIKGNDYRLITVIHHNRYKIYMRAVLTHAEYDKGGWKED